MSSPSERFLDIAVRSLTDNPELQVHARHLLEERMIPAEAEDTSWDTAADALERYDSNPLRRYWVIGMVVVAIIAVLATLLPKGREFLNSIHMSGLGTPSGMPSFGWEGVDRELTRHLTEKQRLIAVGDTSKGSDSLARRALCDRFPENPAYYADYAIAYVTEHRKLPPDYLATAARIDPDNGWFPCFAAGVTARDAVESAKQTSAQKSAHALKTWIVRDQARLDESMRLLETGSRMPRFQSYQSELTAKKMDLLAPAVDFRSRTQRYLHAVVQPSQGLPWMELAKAVATQAEAAAIRNDKAAFHKLFDAWRSLPPRMIEDSGAFLDVMVASGCASISIPNLGDAASRLGLEDEARRMETVKQALDRRREARKARSASLTEDESAEVRGSLLFTGGRLFSAQSTHPPPVDPDQLMAGRLSDQGFLWRFFSLILAKLLLLGSGLLALLRFGKGRLARLVSLRIENTLTTVDWWWILGLGSVMPVLYHEALYRWTPLVGRDWSITYTHFLIPLVQTTAWAHLLITAPLLVSIWRIKRRLQGMDLSLPSTATLVILYCMLALAIPVAGIGWLGGDFKVWAIAGAVLFCAFALWTAVVTTPLSFRRSLGRLAAVRVLLPCHALSALLLTGLSWAYHAQELHWTQVDTITPGGNGSRGMGSYEMNLTETVKGEFLEILAPLEKTR